MVRNDLSDSDLEIVPAGGEGRRQKAEGRGQKAEVRSQETEESGPDWPKQKEKAFGDEVKEEVTVGPVTAWGRATRQLFGVGKT